MNGLPSKYGNCDECSSSLDSMGYCPECDEALIAEEEPAEQPKKVPGPGLMAVGEIEAGVPMPTLYMPHKQRHNFRFAEMKVNDSFQVIPPDQEKVTRERIRSKIGSAFRLWRDKANLLDQQITIRTVLEEVEGEELLVLRVWRTK